MSAIEYGSYYWCVVLNGKDANAPNESVYLHADEVAVEPNGSLTFKSLGRRPPGADPKQQREKKETQDSKKSDGSGKDGSKGGQGQATETSMIYMAFAPGTWKLVYAAKLQDGYPALVEHWAALDAEEAKSGLAAVVPPDAGATGFFRQD